MALEKIKHNMLYEYTMNMTLTMTTTHVPLRKHDVLPIMCQRDTAYYNMLMIGSQQLKIKIKCYVC